MNWKKFRDIMKQCTNDVCGMKRVGGQKRKSTWWTVDVGLEVA